MQIIRRHFALQIGYDVWTDCRYGIILGLGARNGNGSRYRLVLGFLCDWPKVIWRDEIWELNEPGYLRGLPVRRRGIASSAWTGRRYSVAAVVWVRHWGMVWNGV